LFRTPAQKAAIRINREGCFLPTDVHPDRTARRPLRGDQKYGNLNPIPGDYFNCRE
jgi:hypothetical protein